MRHRCHTRVCDHVVPHESMPTDLESYAHWLPELAPGAVVRHPAVPLVWKREVPVASESDVARGGGEKQQMFRIAALEQPVYM